MLGEIGLLVLIVWLILWSPENLNFFKADGLDLDEFLRDIILDEWVFAKINICLSYLVPYLLRLDVLFSFLMPKPSALQAVI